MASGSTCGATGRVGDRVRRVLALTLVAGAALASPRPAEAARVRHIPYPTSVPHITGHEQSVITYYLLGGPARWETTRAPKFPGGLVVTNRFGALKDNVLGEFLTWKRDQNPTQFDLRHPRLAPLFATSTVSATSAGIHASSASPVAKATALETLSPPTTSAVPVPASNVSTPASVKLSLRLLVTPSAAAEFLAVPEPSSAVSALAVVGLVGAWRVTSHRRRLG